MRNTPEIKKLCGLVPLIGLFIACGCHHHHHHHGPAAPSEEALQQREDLATQTANEWLATFLSEPVGIPDENYFVPSFNLDGWDRSQYLSVFWDADDASGIEGGVELTYQGEEDIVSIYDVYVNGSVSPYDFSLPVITEFYLQGQTFQGETAFSDYESLTGLFQLEDSAGIMSFVAPAAWWEYEVLTSPPEQYQYVIGQVAVNSIQAYNADPEPTLLLSKIEAETGATLAVDVQLQPYGVTSDLPVQVRATVKLFIEGSPADLGTLGLPNVGAVHETAVTPPTEPTFTETLDVPDLPAGNYSLVIRVETLLEQAYASDGLVIPVQVF